MDVRVVREAVQWKLWAELEDAAGNIKRLGGDEPDSDNIFRSLNWSNNVPGGHESMQCAVSRDSFLTYADENLFDQIKIRGHAERSAFEGRLTRFPKDSGERVTNFNAVGNSAMLRDHTGVREIYVDIDKTHWEPASVQRRINLNSSISPKYTAQDTQVAADATTGAPALASEITGAWSTTGIPVVEGWYNAGPVPIASLYYAWKINSSVDSSNTNWSWLTELSTDDIRTSVDASGNLRAAGPGTGTLTASGASKYFALAQMSFAVASGNANQLYGLYWTMLAVYGNHGLTKVGTNSATSAQGFYGSDILYNLVSRFAPGLRASLGTDGSIYPVAYIVPHYVIGRDTPGTVEQGVSEINQYYQFDWGVWDNFQFFWAPPGYYDSRTWKVKQSEGAVLSEEGEQADDRYNGVIVQYTDPVGRQRTVGPPGSLTDAQDSTLADTDPDNPVNSHAGTLGGPRWGVLQMSTVTDQPGAIRCGSEWLADTNELKHSGRVKVFNVAEDENGIRRPAYEIRAGDSIQITDGDNIVRRITKVSGSDADRVVECDCDVPPYRLDGLMERMGLQLVGVV